MSRITNFNSPEHNTSTSNNLHHIDNNNYSSEFYNDNWAFR